MIGGAFEAVRAWAARLKREVVALWLAGRDRRVPWHAKAVAVSVAAYALSPIDLVPDVIPVLGYLDDLVVVPLGIALAIRLVPADLMGLFRERARELASRPTSRAGAAAVAAVWLGTLAWLTWLTWPRIVGTG